MTILTLAPLGWLRQLAGAILILAIASAPAVGQGHDYAYVTVPQSHSLSMIEIETNTIIRVVDWGIDSVVSNAALTPDQSRVYFCLTSSDGSEQGIIVEDTASDRGAGNIPFPEGTPTAVAFSPAGDVAYVTVDRGPSTAGVVNVIDTMTLHVIQSTQVGIQPSSITFTPDGRLAYVSNSGSNSVSVIDTTADPPTVFATIGFGSSIPGPVTMAPDGTFAYVASNSEAGGVLFQIATATQTLVDPPIDLGRTFLMPTRAAFSLDGSRAYVGVARNDADPQPGAWLEVVNTGARRVVDVVNLAGLGFFANSVALTTDGSRIYVTGGNLLSDSDNVTWAVSNTLQVQARVWFPRGFAAFPDAIVIGTLQRPDIPHVAYVANSGSNFVSMINTDTDAVTTIPLANPDHRPQVLAINADGRFAHVAVGSAQVAGEGDFLTINTADNTFRGLDNPDPDHPGLPQWTPRGVTVTPPDGTLAFVSVEYYSCCPTINAVDTETRWFRFGLRLPDVEGLAQGMAMTPDGKRVYIAVRSPDKVVALEKTIDPQGLEQWTIIATIPDIPEAQDVAITPNGKLAYVTATHRVVVIDSNPSSPTYNTVVDTIGFPNPFQFFPLTGGIAISPDGRVAYATRDSDVAVIDLSTDTVFRSIGVLLGAGHQCAAVAFTRRGDRAYVPCVVGSSNGVVSVIDTRTMTEVDTVAVGKSPRSVAAR